MKTLSADGQDGRSPRVILRLPRADHARVVELARCTGQTVSELARRAIERELEMAGGRAPPDTGG